MREDYLMLKAHYSSSNKKMCALERHDRVGSTKIDTLYRTLLLWRVTLSQMSWWWLKSSGILHHRKRPNSQKRITCLLLLGPEKTGIIDLQNTDKYLPVDMTTEKILTTPSFRGEVKSSVPCRRFAACKISLNLRGSRNLGKITGQISRPQFHLSLLGSFASLRTYRHLAAKVGTSEGGGKQSQNYQELAQDAVCQSYTGHMTGLWFLPARPLRLNTKWMNEWMAQYLRRCDTSDLFAFFPLLSWSGMIRNVTTQWAAGRTVRRWEGKTNNTVSEHHLWKCEEDSTGVSSSRSAEGVLALSNYYSGCGNTFLTLVTIFKINDYSWSMSRW